MPRPSKDSHCRWNVSLADLVRPLPDTVKGLIFARFHVVWPGLPSSRSGLSVRSSLAGKYLDIAPLFNFSGTVLLFGLRCDRATPYAGVYFTFFKQGRPNRSRSVEGPCTPDARQSTCPLPAFAAPKTIGGHMIIIDNSQI